MFRPVDDLAAFPRHGFDQLYDGLLNTVAEIVGVHGVEFPTTPAVAISEPVESWIGALVGDRERWQSADLRADQCDTPHVHVFAIVFGEPRRQVLLRHES